MLCYISTVLNLGGRVQKLTVFEHCCFQNESGLQLLSGTVCHEQV